MNELQRQRYLSALGIDSFVPRLVLPAARASTACELPGHPVADEAPRVAQPQPAAPTRRAKPAAAESVGQVLKDMAAQPEPAAERQAARPEPPTQRESITPVHLHTWHPGDDLLVIDQSEPGEALPTHRLLQNILRVCRGGHYRVDDGRSMRCPMNDRLAEFYTPADLQVELQAWFATEYQKRPDAEVWLMGEAAARHFLPDGLDYNTACYDRVTLTLGEHEASGAAPTARILPSLSNLLTDTRLKAHLWQALAP